MYLFSMRATMFNKIIVIVDKSFELVVIRIMIRIQEFFYGILWNKGL